MACEWFWSTSDLPQARLHELVDTPFVLRLTCKAMRDAHHKGAEWRPRWPGTIVVYWSGVAACCRRSYSNGRRCRNTKLLFHCLNQLDNVHYAHLGNRVENFVF